MKIVIIGNGPQAAEKKFGTVIDQHDLVVRLTSFRNTNYEGYVGARTDVVFLTPYTIINSDTFHERNKRARYIMVHPRPLSQTEWNKFQNYPRNFGFEMASLREVDLLKAEMGLSPDTRDVWPTTGTIAVDWVVRHYPEADIRVVGFSALTQDTFDSFPHYDGTRSPVGKHHSFAHEVAHLRRLHAAGRIRRLDEVETASGAARDGRLALAKRTLVLCHHPRGQKGGVTATINRLLDSDLVAPRGGLVIDYAGPAELAEANVSAYDTILVNGGNGLADPDILARVLEAHHQDKELIVYWHDNFTIFQKVLARLEELPSLVTVLQAPSTWFWTTSAQNKVALQCALGVERDRIRVVYNVCEVADYTPRPQTEWQPLTGVKRHRYKAVRWYDKVTRGTAIAPRLPRGTYRTGEAPPTSMTRAVAGQPRRIVTVSYKASRDKGLQWFQDLAQRLKDDGRFTFHMITTDDAERVTEVLNAPPAFALEPWTAEFQFAVRGFDALIVASTHESFSLVAAEAFLQGVPPIVTDTCGIAELLPPAHVAADLEELVAAVQDLDALAVADDARAALADMLSFQAFLERVVSDLDEVRAAAPVAARSRPGPALRTGPPAEDPRNPLVSIVMPAYNVEAFLIEAVRSVITQTYSNWELIAINDCSTDRTREILYSFDDPRMVIVNNPQNLGLVGALNVGLQAARGTYIARFDSDDVCLPHRLTEQVTWLRNNPEIDFIGGSMEGIDEAGFLIDKVFEAPEWHPYGLRFMLLKRCPHLHPTVMFHKRVIARVGQIYSPGNRFEDWAAWSRINSEILMHNVRAHRILRYRVRADGLSRNMPRSERMRETRILVRKYCERVSVTPPADPVINYFTFPSMNRPVSFDTMEPAIRGLEDEFIRYIRRWHDKHAAQRGEEYLKEGIAAVEAIADLWVAEFREYGAPTPLPRPGTPPPRPGAPQPQRR